MVFMLLLQNIMDVVDRENGSCCETSAMHDVDEPTEVTVKVEDSENIMDEIAEAISFSPFKTEQEVRLWVHVRR